MAIDTALKRLSAINVGSPWRSLLPLPDGTVGQPDRQVVPFMYSGIAAGAAVTPVIVVSTPGGVRRRGYLRRPLRGYDPEPEKEDEVVVTKRKVVKVPERQVKLVTEILGDIAPVSGAQPVYDVQIKVPGIGERQIAEPIEDEEEWLLLNI